MIEVYYSTCSLGEVPEHDEWLGDREQAVAAGLRIPKRLADWRLGRWTAKTALRAAWPLVCNGDSPPEMIEILAAGDGAPELFGHNGDGPAFSLSHSGGVALCAVAPPGAQVGCDLEQIEARSAALVRDFFCEPEREVVGATPAERRALVINVIWSAKESALKARRTGLRADTRSVRVAWPTGAPDETWTPLTVTPTDQEALTGWWKTSSHGGVLTVVAEPAPRSPIEVSGAIPI